MFDNLSSFKVHFLLAFLVSFIIFLLIKEYKWAMVTLVGVLVNFAAIAPWYFAPANVGSAVDGRATKILMSNVSLRNTDYPRLLQLIESEQPDIFGLIEVNANWIDGISSLREQYPFRVEVPHEHYWGLALYSRIPFTNAQVLELVPTMPPVIVATVPVNSTLVRVVLTHPRPPMTSAETKLRNDQLVALAEFIDQSDLPIVLAGDLNTALWSPAYADFVAKSGLKNARAGHGVGGTWPASSIFGVPIDHVMSSSDVTLQNFRILGPVGSDHLPIAAEFLLPKQSLAYERGSSELEH